MSSSSKLNLGFKLILFNNSIRFDGTPVGLEVEAATDLGPDAAVVVVEVAGVVDVVLEPPGAAVVEVPDGVVEVLEPLGALEVVVQ